MAAIRPVEQSAEKWSRRAAVAQTDYVQGVENPRASWAAAAQAAGQSYRQGVTAAANAGRFEAGVKAAGDERWRRGARDKGPNRFAEGVQLATGEWQRGFGPYQEAIKNLQLPARGPKGSPANLTRVSAVAGALRSLKERSAASGR